VASCVAKCHVTEISHWLSLSLSAQNRPSCDTLENPRRKFLVSCSQDFFVVYLVKSCRIYFLNFRNRVTVIFQQIASAICRRFCAWFRVISGFTGGIVTVCSDGGSRDPGVALRTQNTWPRRGELRSFYYIISSLIGCRCSLLAV